MNHTALEWEEIFSERVPNAAVRDIDAMFDFEQVLAEELVTTVEHPVVGRYRCLQRPVKFSATPGPEPFSAPAQGENAEAVLESAGYDARQIAQLRTDGVIGA